MASRAIFWEVSWMPSPISEAFLLNSDLEECGTGDFDEESTFSDWLTAVMPPIFLSVCDRDWNSAVRSLYWEAIWEMAFDRTVEDRRLNLSFRRMILRSSVGWRGPRFWISKRSVYLFFYWYKIIFVAFCLNNLIFLLI